MNPIISPVWFYLIHVSNMIHVLSLFVLVISIVGLVMLVVGEVGFYPDEERITKKYVKTCVTAIIICSLVLTLVPNARTIYMMLAASVVTPDNIVGGEEHIVNLITNIVTAINNAK